MPGPESGNWDRVLWPALVRAAVVALSLAVVAVISVAIVALACPH